MPALASGPCTGSTSHGKLVLRRIMWPVLIVGSPAKHERKPPTERADDQSGPLVAALRRFPMVQEGPAEIQDHGFVSKLTAALTVIVAGVALGQVSAASGPSFASAVTYGSGGYIAQGVVIADLNRDGKADIVVSNWWNPNDQNQGLVGVLLGNGDGTFQPVVTYATGGSPSYSVVVADVNGDGKPDIVVGSCAPNPSTCGSADGVVSILLGNGDGTFQSARTFDAGAPHSAAVSVADLNGDGKPDVIVANYFGESNGDGTVAVLLGNGDGTFLPAVLYDSGAQNANDVKAADVNGDGVPDLLVANRCDSCASGGVLGVLIGNGDGTFRPAVTYATGGRNSSALAVADLNGDGKQDVVVGNLNISIPSGTVSVLLGTGDGRFKPAVTYNSGGYAAAGLQIADVNGDGKPDLVVDNCGPVGYCGTGVVGVLLGNGNGTFAPVITFSSGAYNSTTLAVGDLNGDGLPDLVAGNQCQPSDCTTGSVSVLLNTSLVGVVSPKTANFGDVWVGHTSVGQRIRLKNLGISKITVSKISISGDFALAVNDCDQGVQPETHCDVYVTFMPKALGKQTGTLTFVDNAVNTPQKVLLTGVGAKPRRCSITEDCEFR